MRATIFEIAGVFISAALFGLFAVILADTREPFVIEMIGVFAAAVMIGGWGVSQHATWVGGLYGLALMVLGLVALVFGVILFIPWIIGVFTLYTMKPLTVVGVSTFLSLPVYCGLPALYALMLRAQ